MSDHDRLIFYAARYAYQRRALLTPKNGITWGDWFTRTFGLTLDQYVDEAVENRIKDRV